MNPEDECQCKHERKWHNPCSKCKCDAFKTKKSAKTSAEKAEDC